jgi:hypothetical protein
MRNPSQARRITGRLKRLRSLWAAPTPYKLLNPDVYTTRFSSFERTSFGGRSPRAVSRRCRNCTYMLPLDGHNSHYLSACYNLSCTPLRHKM